MLRRRGTHVRLRLENDRGVWFDTIPDHLEIAKGTLRSILRRIGIATGQQIEALIEQLAE